MKKALASYCTVLAQLNKGMWKDFLTKYVTGGWKLAGLNNVKKLDDKTVSKFFDHSENLILVICGDKKAKESIDMSDVIFLVLDASAGILEQDRELIDKCNPKRTIVILNKCDLNKKIEKEELLSTFSDRIVEISAINGEGIEKLKEIFENIVGISDIEPSNMVISNERQLNVMNNVKKILEEALEEIDQKMTFDAVTVLLQDAVEKIMEITGESASEAVVNKIFSKFCVGK